MEADRVLLRKAPSNVSIVDVEITSPKSAGRNLDILSGHSYLISPTIPGSSTLVLSQEKYDRL